MIEKRNIVLFGSSGLIGMNLKKKLEKKFNIFGFDLKKKSNDNYICDANNYKQTEKKISLLLKKINKIDAIIICVYPKIKKKNFDKSLDLNFKELSNEVNNHLKPFYNLNKIFIKYFEKKKGGVILNFASIYGSFLPRFEIYKNTKMNMPIYYSIAKSSIIMMTKYLAKEYLDKKIRINSISPGGVFDFQNKSFLKNYGKFCAHKNLLDEEDVSGLVEFLVSEESKKITGQDFIIDDGFTL